MFANAPDSALAIGGRTEGAGDTRGTKLLAAYSEKTARTDLWSFMATCERATHLDELERAFFGELEQLGFVSAGLVSHVKDAANMPSDAVWLYRCPSAFVELYQARELHPINPLLAAANDRTSGFFWDDPWFRDGLSDRQKWFMGEMAALGLSHGCTIPIRSYGALPASCTLVPSRDGVPEHHFLLGHSISVFAHEASRRLLGAQQFGVADMLTERECLCLALAARGKSDWTISELLGVSEGAVHKAIERTKRKLGVATRVQAVVRAIHLGRVQLADLL